MKAEDLTWEQIKELIPNSVSLHYVDYRESLDKRLETVQQAIQDGDYVAISEVVWDCYDQDQSGIEYCIQELRDELVSTYDLDKEVADEIVDTFQDDIRETLWDRDDSDVIKDLLRNTGSHTMHYDTGYYMDGESWSWDEKRVVSEGRQIKKALGLKMGDTTWDDELHVMIRQASYGGSLVVFFYDTVADYIVIDENFNMLTFKNAHIAIINTGNGSGDDCFLKGSEFTLPLTKDNIFIDHTFKYSYTHSVCGMSSNWCDSTEVSFTEKKTKKVIEKSAAHQELSREKEYNKTYKAGSCTLGDSDINRHRNTSYINDYPCGNKCKDCGQFWID